jgi:trans-2,3-dihydro-3-hydroxyanthranilate isomerase
MARHWYDLRVFTRDGDGGNPLAVIPDGVEVPAEAMQKAALEIGYPETVFLDWTEDTMVPKMRIFTPSTELDFAGHPLVGAVWLLFDRGPRTIEGIEPPVGRMECGAGDGSAWIKAPLPPVERAAGGWRAGLGQTYRLAELASSDEVAAATPVTDDAVCVFAAPAGGPAKMRFFATPMGVPEDAATGSAAVALAAVLHGEGRLPSGQVLEILQGDEVGRPSRISVSVEGGHVRLEGAVALDGVRHIKI